MTWTTTDPRSAGRAGKLGAVVKYVTGGALTTLVKVGAAATDWTAVTAVLPAAPMDASRCQATASDPRIAGRAGDVDEIVLFDAAGTGVYLIKFGTGDTDWVPLPTSGGGGVPSSRALNATSPIRIDGGASGDLSANRTISVLDNSTSSKGVVAIAPNDRSKVWLGDATWGRLAVWVWIFGSGIDGNLHFDGVSTVTLADGTTMVPSGNVYTAPRSISGDAIVIDSGVTVKMHGLFMYSKSGITGSGTISVKGNDGGNATGSTVSGAAGAVIAQTMMNGVAAGIVGGTGLPSADSNNAPLGFVPGSTAAAANDSAGVNGGVGSGGSGGAGGKESGGVSIPGGASSGVVTLMTAINGGPLMDTAPSMFSGKSVTTSVLFTWGTAGTAGRAGGGSQPGRGGGSGTAGGACGIWALTIANTITIDARGGNGGNGGNGTGGFGGGGGGGGAGGAGGVVSLVQGYGTLPTITITGGSGGTGGAPDTTGHAGFTGGNGGAGMKFTYLLVP